MTSYNFFLSLLNKFHKSKTEEGFSLVELLVVILIIGLLSAIALPTFLNQANKARQAEASTTTGTLLRLQAVYYQENLKYTTDFEELGTSININRINSNPGRNFTYSLTSGNTSEYVIVAAIPETQALAGVAGRVSPDDNFLCSLDQSVPAERGSNVAQQLVSNLTSAISCPAPSEIAN